MGNPLLHVYGYEDVCDWVKECVREALYAWSSVWGEQAAETGQHMGECVLVWVCECSLDSKNIEVWSLNEINMEKHLLLSNSNSIKIFSTANKYQSYLAAHPSTHKKILSKTFHRMFGGIYDSVTHLTVHVSILCPDPEYSKGNDSHF